MNGRYKRIYRMENQTDSTCKPSAAINIQVLPHILCHISKNNRSIYSSFLKNFSFRNNHCFSSSSLPFSLPFFCSKRSEEHTSELQSRGHLLCRILLEKNNNS